MRHDVKATLMRSPDADTLIRQALPSDARQIAEAHVASWRTTYAGIVAEDYLARLSVDTRERQWSERITRTADPNHRMCVLVAANPSGDILGFVSAGPRVEGPADYAGEIYSLYLIEQAQGLGIGRRLLRAGAAHLLSVGMTSMSLWVLAANPSRSFYERMGGRLVETTIEMIGGATLEKCGYGWSDITALSDL